MRNILPAIVLFFFGCTKDGSSKTASIFYDSSSYAWGGEWKGYYRLDINADNIPDLKLGWYGFSDPAGPSAQTAFSYIVALHNQASIHATKQFAQFCKDTTYPYGPWPYTKIYNCAGGPKYFRTDTFVATPNIDTLKLASTQVNKMSDSVTVYDAYSYGQSYSFSETRNHGFFRECFIRISAF